MSLPKEKKFKNKLRRASQEKDKALRGVKIASVLAEGLRTLGVDPILVGGAAVAFYTEGRFTTQDVDMIAPSGKDVENLMMDLGFSGMGKDYINTTLGIYVEFPSETLGPTEKFQLIKVDRLPPLKMISLEDLIVDRLCAYKFWKSAIDGLNALMLLELGLADVKRVEDRSREEDVLDALDYLQDVLETTTRRKLMPSQANRLIEKYFRN